MALISAVSSIGEKNVACIICVMRDSFHVLFKEKKCNRCGIERHQYEHHWMDNSLYENTSVNQYASTWTSKIPNAANPYFFLNIL